MQDSGKGIRIPGASRLRSITLSSWKDFLRLYRSIPPRIGGTKWEKAISPATFASGEGSRLEPTAVPAPVYHTRQAGSPFEPRTMAEF